MSCMKRIAIVLIVLVGACGSRQPTNDVSSRPDPWATPNKGPLEQGRGSDRDGDGIRDNVDRCPDDAEDFDGFEDEDGCPDPDNDRDGILDANDKCPNVPEDKDGVDDDDGCPEDDKNR